jgi:hypothetical protein
MTVSATRQMNVGGISSFIVRLGKSVIRKSIVLMSVPIMQFVAASCNVNHVKFVDLGPRSIILITQIHYE